MRGDPKLRRRFGRMLRALHFIDAQGVDRVPSKGRVVVALNHCGVRGALVFESTIARDIVFIASHRFFRVPLINKIARRISALYVSPADMICTRLLDEAADLVRGGSLLGVMVTGRQMNQVQAVPKRGAVYLAYRLQASILPVQVLKHGLVVRIRVGDLMPPPRSVNAYDLNERLTQVCDQLGLAT